MQTFNQLKKNLKNDFSHLKKIKIALLGDSATQFLTQAIKGDGFNKGLNADIFEADFNQIERQIFDSHSELYLFQPDIILIFFSAHKLLSKYNKLAAPQMEQLADTQLELIKKITTTISAQTTAKIIYYNYNEIDDAVKFLSDTDDLHAQLESEYKFCEEKIKQAKSHAYLLSTGTVAERQAQAETHPTTTKAVLEWIEALKEFKTLTNQRNSQIRLSELWQTLSANRRKGTI